MKLSTTRSVLSLVLMLFSTVVASATATAQDQDHSFYHKIQFNTGGDEELKSCTDREWNDIVATVNKAIGIDKQGHHGRALLRSGHAQRQTERCIRCGRFCYYSSKGCPERPRFSRSADQDKDKKPHDRKLVESRVAATTADIHTDNDASMMQCQARIPEIHNALDGLMSSLSASCAATIVESSMLTIECVAVLAVDVEMG